MQVKQTAGLFLTCFLVLAILGILAAIAIPHAGHMIHKSEAEARTTEFYKIKAAVTDMLLDSRCGTLEPVGPTSDMSQVRTRDVCPLVLSDYLDDIFLNTGCRYSFAADGAVIQVVP